MLDEILANARQIDQRLDAVFVQLLRGSDARQQQQLCRAVYAAGENHLARGGGRPTCAPLHIVDPDGAPALEPDAAHQRMGFDREIRPAHGGLEKYPGGAATPSARDGHLIALESLRLRAVVVVGGGESRGDARRADFPIQHVRCRHADLKLAGARDNRSRQPAFFGFRKYGSTSAYPTQGRASRSGRNRGGGPRVDHAVDHGRSARPLPRGSRCAAFSLRNSNSSPGAPHTWGRRRACP